MLCTVHSRDKSYTYLQAEVTHKGPCRICANSVLDLAMTPLASPFLHWVCASSHCALTICCHLWDWSLAANPEHYGVSPPIKPNMKKLRINACSRKISQLHNGWRSPRTVLPDMSFPETSPSNTSAISPNGWQCSRTTPRSHASDTKGSCRLSTKSFGPSVVSGRGRAANQTHQPNQCSKQGGRGASALVSDRQVGEAGGFRVTPHLWRSRA